ncbi:MAG: replication protein [Nitrospiraceae bacterium]|nr:replication protein [Nitrospiraceae bacterium]
METKTMSSQSTKTLRERLAVNGFVQVSYKLADLIFGGDLSKNEIQVLMAVVRMTVGFQQSENEVSTHTLEELTGIDRRHIFRALWTLEHTFKVFTRTQRAYRENGVTHKVNSYRIRDEWLYHPRAKGEKAC